MPEAAQIPASFWEVAIVHSDGRPDDVITPVGGVPKSEALSVLRTYRDTVDPADGRVELLVAREG